MPDTCLIKTRTQTEKTNGEKVDDFTTGTSSICGLDMRPGTFRRGREMTEVTYDATIRLPHDASVTLTGKITVTKRFGETISPNLDFLIAGVIQRGPSGIRLALRYERAQV
jgi:hypothetical protein